MPAFALVVLDPQRDRCDGVGEDVVHRGRLMQCRREPPATR